MCQLPFGPTAARIRAELSSQPLRAAVRSGWPATAVCIRPAIRHGRDVKRDAQVAVLGADFLQRGNAGEAVFVLEPLRGSALLIPWKKRQPAIADATLNDPTGSFNVAGSRLSHVPSGQIVTLKGGGPQPRRGSKPIHLLSRLTTGCTQGGKFSRSS